jgi:hypothetical protein
MTFTRRRFLDSCFRGAAAGLAVSAFQQSGRADEQTDLPPVRTITSGPRHHWFGYYDKLQFDPTSRYVLGMQVGFEHRSPKPDDVIGIGMVDLHDDDRWIPLSESSAWGWQQGCMLQWIPGSKTRIVWNDREADRYVCRILDTKSGEQQTVPHAIYALSPDGRRAASTDYRRINDVRPGYGYAGLPDPHTDDLAPKKSGITRVDLETGKEELIISIAEIAALGTIPNAQPGIKHYFNHLLFNTDGTRFIFLHRWRYPNGRRLTRMLTARPDGGDIRIVDDNGLTSHFIWRDPRHILAWSEQPSHGKAFYLFEDGGDQSITAIGPDVLTRDGHCSYLPGNEWILNDTYPDGQRNQTPHLYHVETSRRVSLGHFHLPPEYTGEWRCDTHPRHNPDGTLVCIDSPHPGQGRQLHLIDISSIVGAS